MVDLSCLIVIAALFSQISTTIPASANPKAIDYFFFYLILKLSVVFLHHLLLLIISKHIESKYKNAIQPSDSKKTLEKAYLPHLKECWKSEDNVTMGSRKAKRLAKRGEKILYYFNFISVTLMTAIDFVVHVGFVAFILIARKNKHDEFYVEE